MIGDAVPVPDTADRVAARLRERNLYAEEVARAASGFPSYEVPAFVAERYPEFRPEDPSTWPEPDRCTDGRPWGHDAYAPGGMLGSSSDYRWRKYLAAAAAVAAGGRVARWQQRDLGCRNRWRDEETRLCGTHVKPYREAVEDARKRLARNARELEHLDLARQLGAHGIVADGFADSVRLQADAVRDLLRLLGVPRTRAERVEVVRQVIDAELLDDAPDYWPEVEPWAERIVDALAGEEVTASSDPWPDQGPTPEPPL